MNIGVKWVCDDLTGVLVPKSNQKQLNQILKVKLNFSFFMFICVFQTNTSIKIKSQWKLCYRYEYLQCGYAA